MTRRLRPALSAALAGILAAGLVAPASAQVGGPFAAEAGRLWNAWRDSFVSSDGRVIDNANGNISHSEGQGYGLLLAYYAGDRVAFERIWSFTRTQLLVRDDGLAAWRWDPASTPRITDINNASDGDILIAYALAMAGSTWDQEGLVAAAATIAEAVGEQNVIRHRGLTVLLPGADGFRESERDDGPVVNPSYWIFEALPVMAALAPEADWQGVSDSGLALLRTGTFGPAELPPEWLALGGAQPQPAAGFDRVYGYNAIRIPLYLMRSGLATPSLVEPYLAARDARGAPAVILLDNGTRMQEMPDQGYRMALAAVDCAVNNVPVPEDLLRFYPDLYYPATLYLLSWLYLAEAHPACL